MKTLDQIEELIEENPEFEEILQYMYDNARNRDEIDVLIKRETRAFPFDEIQFGNCSKHIPCFDNTEEFIEGLSENGWEMHLVSTSKNNPLFIYEVWIVKK